MSSRRSRAKKIATPERAENRFAREFMEIARLVVASPGDQRTWRELCDLRDAYGKNHGGIEPR